MRRYEITEEQYELIEDLMPPNGRRGSRWNDHRTTLNGIFRILHAGPQWREMPERYACRPFSRNDLWPPLELLKSVARGELGTEILNERSPPGDD